MNAAPTFPRPMPARGRGRYLVRPPGGGADANGAELRGGGCAAGDGCLDWMEILKISATAFAICANAMRLQSGRDGRRMRARLMRKCWYHCGTLAKAFWVQP